MYMYACDKWKLNGKYNGKYSINVTEWIRKNFSN
jgi:hypothetical protein